jgi:hypothetical protein
MAEMLQGTTSNFKVLFLVGELSEFLNLIKKTQLILRYQLWNKQNIHKELQSSP